MIWFKHLPQKTGEFLWCMPDLHCWIHGIVSVCLLSQYRKEYIPQLGTWETGKNGGSFRYQFEDGTEAVMCFGLHAPCKKSNTNEPDVDAWTEFKGPE
jgi:hypothetical protein